MVEIAPRYNPQILDAVYALDDRSEPMAEIARRVGRVAAELGLPKPSYVHLRRYIRVKREAEDEARERAAAIRAIFTDAYFDAMHSKVVNAYEIADRIRALDD